MFGVGFWELVIIGLLIIFLLKPDDLPVITYKAGKIFSKIKMHFNKAQQEFNNLTKNLHD